MNLFLAGSTSREHPVQQRKPRDAEQHYPYGVEERSVAHDEFERIADVLQDGEHGDDIAADTLSE